jgi:murein DD-endopeptidase MepM/ murein hydrolase activator NlpD
MRKRELITQIRQTLDVLDSVVRPLDSPIDLTIPGVRFFPNFGELRPGYVHSGIDGAAPEGTPILASTDCRVFRVVNKEEGAGAWGKRAYVELLAPGYSNISVRYCHCRDIHTQVGKILSKGDLIGYVGHTGTTSRDLSKGRNGDHVCLGVVRGRYFWYSKGQNLNRHYNPANIFNLGVI